MARHFIFNQIFKKIEIGQIFASVGPDIWPAWNLPLANKLNSNVFTNTLFANGVSGASHVANVQNEREGGKRPGR